MVQLHHPTSIIVQWLLCDGESSRSYRRTLISHSLKYVGIATGPHRCRSTITVLMLAKHFIGKKNLASRKSIKINKERPQSALGRLKRQDSTMVVSLEPTDAHVDVRWVRAFVYSLGGQNKKLRHEQVMVRNEAAVDERSSSLKHL